MLAQLTLTLRYTLLTVAHMSHDTAPRVILHIRFFDAITASLHAALRTETDV